MKLPDPEVRDSLCAEYAVGTLRGGARRRFETLLTRDPDLQRRLAGWQAMLPTERQRESLPQPAKAVWCGIRRRLGFPGPWREFFDRIAGWHGWAVTTMATLALAIGLGIGFETARRAELPSTGSGVSMMSGQDGEFLALVRIDSDRGMLRVALPGGLQPPAGKVFEFWHIAPGSRAPVSLGVQASLGGELAIRSGRRELLRRGGTLAISLEPVGGSPTGLPTGPVLFTAPLTGG